MWVLFKEQLFLFMCWPKGGEKEGMGAGCWGWLGRVWVTGAKLLSLAACQRLGQCTFNVAVGLPGRWCSGCLSGGTSKVGQKRGLGQFIDSALWASSPRTGKSGCPSSISWRWQNTTVYHLEEPPSKTTGGPLPYIVGSYRRRRKHS